MTDLFDYLRKLREGIHDHDYRLSEARKYAYDAEVKFKKDHGVRPSEVLPEREEVRLLEADRGLLSREREDIVLQIRSLLDKVDLPEVQESALMVELSRKAEAA